MLPRVVTIESSVAELDSGEVFTWTLANGDALANGVLAGNQMAGQPGQFNMLYLFGSGEVPISISGRDSAGRLQHTIRSVGRITRAMSQVSAGDQIGLRGPFGVGWPLAETEDRDLLVIAGGLGLAPVRQLLQLMVSGSLPCRRLLLLFGVRTPSDLLFRSELEQWAEHPQVEIRVTVDRADSNWRGDIGVVPRLLQRGGFDPARALAFVCGPEVMMRFSVQALQQQGVADEAIYLSMERSMKCAVGLCGRCQWRERFICRDGPVFRYDQIAPQLNIREL